MKVVAKRYKSFDETARISARRWAYMVSGCISLSLGGLGILVPGLPTVVFWIISAWCFGKSCPAMQRWIYTRPKVGPVIQLYNENHMMTHQSKRSALVGMWLGMGLSVMLLLVTAKPIWIPGIITACGLGVTWYIQNRVATAEPLANTPAKTASVTS